MLIKSVVFTLAIYTPWELKYTGYSLIVWFNKKQFLFVRKYHLVLFQI